MLTDIESSLLRKRTVSSVIIPDIFDRYSPNILPRTSLMKHHPFRSDQTYSIVNKQHIQTIVNQLMQFFTSIRSENIS